MFGKHTNSVLALAAFVAVGVLLPDVDNNNNNNNTGRKLSVEQQTSAAHSRRLAADINKCQSTDELFFDDFEGGNDGWSEDSLYKSDKLTQILGRFDATTKPTKTYDVGTDSDFVKVELDFIELDSWDNSTQYGFDTLLIDINGDEINVGTFVGGQDDGERAGVSTGGIKWSAISYDPPSNLGGNTAFTDQKHHIVAYVPKDLYPNGNLKITFHAKVSQAVSDESAGFDNIRLSTMKGCDDTVPQGPLDPETCKTEVEKDSDDFTDGDGGFTGGKTYSSPALGQVLGRFGNQDEPSKTYTVGTDSDFIKIELDFIELDSWDNSTQYGFDTLVITVNDEEIGVGTFVGGSNDDGMREGTTLNGIKWTMKSLGAPSELGGSTNWIDQKHGFVGYVPAALYPDGSITLGFKAKISQNVDDESAAFDNIVMTALSNCNDGGGVNGDPLIMGLSGQLFKFDGRSGAWYSAVSSRSFQWNMKIQEYDQCPDDANKFVSGVGFSIFKNTHKGREAAHKIVVNVVNEFGTQTGCGTEATNCLGNGSLELIIDDKKFLYPGDYQMKDGSGRVIAFNTFYECSRKWYDFDVTPVNHQEQSSNSLRASRRLMKFPGVFDIVRGLENSMVDKDVCDDWIADRQMKNDLFSQAGEWSTIIVKTDQISFHVEYKQEHRRCNAHTVDVWISGVSPELYDEDWEGVIGETKDPANHGDEKVERVEILKYPEDSSYEVVSPFASKCDGCYQP